MTTTVEGVDHGRWPEPGIPARPAARRFFLVALQLAAEAGDVQQRVHTLTSAARQDVWLDGTDLGRDLMRLAHAEDQRLSPVAQAVLTTVEARALGRAADVAGAERAVGQADDLSAQRAADPDDPAWAWYYDNAQMTGDGGRALFDAAMRSGDTRIATMARQRLHAAYDLHPADAARSRSIDLLRVACSDCGLTTPTTASPLPGKPSTKLHSCGPSGSSLTSGCSSRPPPPWSAMWPSGRRCANCGAAPRPSPESEPVPGHRRGAVRSWAGFDAHPPHGGRAPRLVATSAALPGTVGRGCWWGG